MTPQEWIVVRQLDRALGRASRVAGRVERAHPGIVIEIWPEPFRAAVPDVPEINFLIYHEDDLDNSKQFKMGGFTAWTMWRRLEEAALTVVGPGPAQAAGAPDVGTPPVWPVPPQSVVSPVVAAPTRVSRP